MIKMGPIDGVNVVLFSKRYEFDFELRDSKSLESCSYLTGIIAAVTPVKYELGFLYITVYPWCTDNNSSTTTEQYLHKEQYFCQQPNSEHHAYESIPSWTHAIS